MDTALLAWYECKKYLLPISGLACLHKTPYGFRIVVDTFMAENFFSILKAECIYPHKPATFSEANQMIDRYIHFYNHERIQLKTGEAPLARRLSA
ncbi:MAG: IS3 family transposase [Clostridiales bacterium]|nr:IS3 family transposase [Clostridiales bacterium]MDY4035844.1 IS3 family transposase [Candidatus Pseudoscilispira sp.]